MTPQQETPWTVADELQLGLNLYRDITDRYKRGEDVPDDLAQTWLQFSQQMGEQAFAGRSAAAEAFESLWRDVQADSFDLLGEEQNIRARHQAEFMRSLQERFPTIPRDEIQAQAHDLYMRDAAAEGDALVEASRPPKIRGLRDKNGAVRRIGTKEDDDGTYYIKPELAQQLYARDPEALRNLSILRGSDPPEYRTINGVQHEIRRDAEGKEYDFTEYRQLLDRPYVEDLIRRSFTGQQSFGGKGRAGQFGQVGGTLLSGVGIPQAAHRLILGAGDDTDPSELLPTDPSRLNVRTVDPGFRIPAWFELPDNLSLNQLRWDPVFVRALREKAERMADEGKISRGALEASLATGAFLGEFALLNEATALVGRGALGLAGKALSKSERFRGHAAMLESIATGAKAQTALSRNSLFAFPLNTHFGKLAAQFGWYNAITGLGDPNKTLSDAALHGVADAAKISVLGTSIHLLRVGKLLTWPLRALSPFRAFASMDPLGKLAGETPKQKFLESLVDVLPSRSEAFTEAAAKAARAGPLLKMWERTGDAVAMGLVMGSYQWAASFPKWKDLPRSDQAELLLRGMASGEALGTALAFSFSGAVQAASFGARGGMPPPEAIQSWVRWLGGPHPPERFERVVEALEKWREQEPELFEGIKPMTEEEARERAQREADALNYPIWREELEGLRDRGPALPEEDVRRYMQRLDSEAAALVQKVGQSAEAAKRTTLTEPLMSGESLRRLGLKGKPHALNLVNQYLRAHENLGDKPYQYDRLDKVPVYLLLDAVKWDRSGQPAKGQLELANRPGGVAPEEAARSARGEAQRQGVLRDQPGGVSPEEAARAARGAGEQLGFRPGEQDLGAIRLPKPEPGARVETLGQEYERLRGERGYRDKAPIEVAAEGRRRKIERPRSRRKAWELFNRGEATPEDLKRWFPEGAKYVGTRETAAQWAKQWDRAVLQAWRYSKEGEAARQRAKDAFTSRKKRLAERPDIVTWLRMAGGIGTESLTSSGVKQDYSAEFRELVDKAKQPRVGGVPEDARGEELLGPLVSKKGGAPEALAEAAHQAGFIENPDAGELFEAVEATLRGDRRFSKESGGTEQWGATLEREAREASSIEELRQWREGIESGDAPVPEDPTERRQLFERVYAGDERFAGGSYADLEREVMEIRQESLQLGAPPADLRADMPADVVQDKLERSSSRTIQAWEHLSESGLLPPNTPVHDPLTARTIHDLAVGEGGAYEALEAAVGPQRAAMVRDAAIEAKASAIDAAREMLGREKTPEAAEFLDVIEAANMQERGDDLTPELRERLAPLLDEHGLLHPAAIENLHDRIHLLLTEARKAMPKAEQELHAGFVIPLVTNGKFSLLTDTGFGRTLLLGRWLGGPAREFLNKNPWALKLYSMWASFTNGPHFGAMDRMERGTMQRFSMEVLGAHQGRNAGAVAKLHSILSSMQAHWGSLGSIPEAHQRFFTDGIRKRWFQNARSGADFDKMQPGTGYLFEAYRDWRDLADELGQGMLDLGLISPEQFDVLRGGGYEAHEYLRAEDARFAEQLARGQLYNPNVSRSLSRKGSAHGVEATAMRLLDPALWMSSAVRQETRTIGFFGALQHTSADAGYWLPEDAVKKMDAWGRSRYRLAAIPARLIDTPRGPEAVGLKGEKLRGMYPPEAIRMGVVLQAFRDRMAKPGDQPKGDQIHYTEKLDKLLGFYLDGKNYLRLGVANELDVLVSENHRIAVGVPGFWGHTLPYALRTWISWWKRGRTMGRMRHWVLNVGNGIPLNHAAGAVPVWDFARSVFTGTGHYADSWRHVGSYQSWLREGMPKQRPASMSEKQWGEAMSFKDFTDRASGGSFIQSALAPDILGELYSAIGDPAAYKESLRRQMEATAAANGWEPSQREEFVVAIEEFTNRLEPAMRGLDRKIGGFLNDVSPVAHAQAQAAWAALYQTVELGVLKYPAYLRARAEWPHIPTERLIAYALASTGNPANTSPLMRSWARAQTPFSNPLWKGTESARSRWARGAIGFAMQSKFWSFISTMRPLQARWLLTHPVQTTTIAALGMTMANWLTYWKQEDPDEWDRFVQELAQSRFGALHPKPDSDIEQNLAGKFLGKAAIPTPWGPKHLPDWVVEFGSRTWSRLKLGDPFLVETLPVAGRTRATTLAPLTASYGQLIEDARNFAEIWHGVGHLSSSEGASSVAEAGVRLIGKSGELALAGVFGVPRLSTVLSSDDPMREMWLGIARAAADTAPMMSPGIGWTSSEGQHALQQLFADGLTWNEAIRRVIRDYKPETSGQILSELGLYVLWPSRGVYQRNPITGRDDGARALLREVLGPLAVPDPNTEPEASALAAQRAIQAQASELFAETYRKFNDEYPLGRTLDERVGDELYELAAHTTNDMTGIWRIQDGYEPQSTLLRFISRYPEEDQHWLIRYARSYFSRETFQEDGMAWLFEAGRRAELPPSIFSDALRNALADPTGQDLIAWWERETRDEDPEKLAQLAGLVWDIRQPEISADGTVPANWLPWRKVMDRYARAGVKLPEVLSDEARDSIEAVMGDKLILQGGPSAATEIQRMPLRPVQQNRRSLEELFK